MKKFIGIVAVLTALLIVAVNSTRAQIYHNDGGVLVTEDSLLSQANHKQVVFVVAKDIPGSVRMEMQTQTSAGVVNQFQALQFPQGVKRGQIIPVFNGDFNQFYSTPWFYTWVTMTTATDVYYSSTMFPVDYREQYKEPLIASVSETGGYGVPYTITLKGVFDTTISSLILINTGIFVSPKAITQTAPGIIQFTMPSGNFDQFPSGKYLLTICQASHCDTLVGRHR